MPQTTGTPPLPDRLRAARKAAGFVSQDAFGKAVGTSRIHVNAWETGRHAPSFEYAKKIAELLGGEPEHWMAQDGNGPRRRGEEALALRLEALMEGMVETNREILGLLVEIRNSVAPPRPPADGDAR